MREWRSIEGETSPRCIEDGDVILLLHGHAHALCDELASPLTQALHLNYETYREHRLFPCQNERATMVRALCLLKNEVRMERITQQLGYDSEAAFRKALKHEVGIPLARYRQQG